MPVTNALVSIWENHAIQRELDSAVKKETEKLHIGWMHWTLFLADDRLQPAPAVTWVQCKPDREYISLASSIVVCLITAYFTSQQINDTVSPTDVFWHTFKIS